MIRRCAACDGSGRIDHFGAAGSHTVVVCLACGSSGRVTERIPASDALADAETLRLVAFERFEVYAGCYGPKSTRRKSYRHSSRARLPLMDAATLPFPKNISAAFRAVPGLRA